MVTRSITQYKPLQGRLRMAQPRETVYAISVYHTRGYIAYTVSPGIQLVFHFYVTNIQTTTILTHTTHLSRPF